MESFGSSVLKFNPKPAPSIKSAISSNTNALLKKCFYQGMLPCHHVQATFRISLGHRSALELQCVNIYVKEWEAVSKYQSRVGIGGKKCWMFWRGFVRNLLFPRTDPEVFNYYINSNRFHFKTMFQTIAFYKTKCMIWKSAYRPTCPLCQGPWPAEQ